MGARPPAMPAACIARRAGGGWLPFDEIEPYQRRSECAALTWADISREPDGSGRVYAARSKSDQQAAGAVVAITAGTIHDLDAVRAGAPDAAALGLIKAGHRADDGETDWPAAPWS